MSVWDSYPTNYRAGEAQRLLTAVQAGECAAVIGLSGSGKSNLLGFIAHRLNNGTPAFALIDCNRVSARSAAGLLRLIQQKLAPGAPDEEVSALEIAIANRLENSPHGLCLLLDRYDALGEAERAAAAGPLRALRDAFKYQLTYIIAARRPLEADNELSELFYANTLWLGPLSAENARWSAAQYAARHALAWDSETLERLIDISRAYPALLRACCEAHAAGADLTLSALRDHAAVQRRVHEFWSDHPTETDLIHSGLNDHSLLSTGQPASPGGHSDLTASEHRLLAYFRAHPDEICGKDELIQAVWPEERVINGLRDDCLAQLVRRLRRKIEPDPSSPQQVVTIPGRGYRYQSNTSH
jgi:energy-coupling factor transporter ATP-binding protein EcfA2